MKRVSFMTMVGAAALMLLPSTASAQMGPGGGIPTKKEIIKKIREAFPELIEKSPEAKVEFKGLLKLKYKQIPTDPRKIAATLGKQVAGGQLPKGINIDNIIRPYLGQIASMLNEFLRDIGEFEALKEIHVRSKKIPVGKHRFGGILFSGEKPVALIVFNKDKKIMKKPVLIRLKTKSTKLQDAVKIELKKPKHKKKGHLQADLYLACLRYKAKTKKPLFAKVEDSAKK